MFDRTSNSSSSILNTDTQTHANKVIAAQAVCAFVLVAAKSSNKSAKERTAILFPTQVFAFPECASAQ